jgi:hypothetical protein
MHYHHHHHHHHYYEIISHLARKMSVKHDLHRNHTPLWRRQLATSCQGSWEAGGYPADRGASDVSPVTTTCTPVLCAYIVVSRHVQ